VYEGVETFTVHLYEPSNAIPGNVTGTGVILEDDPPPALFVDDTTVVEGGPGAGNQAVFAVRLSTNAAVPVSLYYVTADGSALAGVDYQPLYGTLTIPPGLTSTNIKVSINGDA